MDKLLKYLSIVAGASCVAIGLFHIIGGPDTVFGGGAVNASTDSQERFFAGMFIAYGAAWIWAGLQTPIRATAVRFLAAALLVGGIGRVVSLVAMGSPHPFWVAMLLVEIVVPAFFLAIAGADEKARSMPTDRAGQ